MTVTGSILLIVVGAILYFATDLQVAHVDVDTVGLILTIAGAAGLVVGLALEASEWRQVRRDVYARRQRDFRPPPR